MQTRLKHWGGPGRAGLFVATALLGGALDSMHGAELPVALAIANAGFESNAAANGFVVIGTPASWTVYNSQNINGSSDAVGVINPTGTLHFPAGAQEGRNAAVIFMGGPATGPAGLQQTLGAVLQGDRRYTLQVAVGNIASGTANFGYFNLAGFPGYRIDLLAGGVALAADNNTLAGSIPEGEFRTATLVAAIPAAHPAVGSALQIRLVNLNQPGTTAAPGIEVNFDEVRLTMEPARPELSSTLTIDRAVVMAWSDLAGRFFLERLGEIGSGAWENVTPLPTRSNGVSQVTLVPTEGAAFFRLRAHD